MTARTSKERPAYPAYYGFCEAAWAYLWIECYDKEKLAKLNSYGVAVNMVPE